MVERTKISIKKIGVIGKPNIPKTLSFVSHEFQIKEYNYYL